MIKGGSEHYPKGMDWSKTIFKVFLGPYGSPHANKYKAKKFLHFSFLATAIPFLDGLKMDLDSLFIQKLFQKFTLFHIVKFATSHCFTKVRCPASKFKL